MSLKRSNAGIPPSKQGLRRAYPSRARTRLRRYRQTAASARDHRPPTPWRARSRAVAPARSAATIASTSATCARVLVHHGVVEARAPPRARARDLRGARATASGASRAAAAQPRARARERRRQQEDEARVARAARAPGARPAPRSRAAGRARARAARRARRSSCRRGCRRTRRTRGRRPPPTQPLELGARHEVVVDGRPARPAAAARVVCETENSMPGSRVDERAAHGRLARARGRRHDERDAAARAHSGASSSPRARRAAIVSGFIAERITWSLSITMIERVRRPCVASTSLPRFAASLAQALHRRRLRRDDRDHARRAAPGCRSRC